MVPYRGPVQRWYVFQNNVKPRRLAILAHDVTDAWIKLDSFDCGYYWRLLVAKVIDPAVTRCRLRNVRLKDQKYKDPLRWDVEQAAPQ